MSKETLDLTIEPSTIPKCPSCGERGWRIHERITRYANLERVDGLRDLVVDSRDESTYDQALLMECLHCGSRFLPQAEVGSKSEKIEAWHQSTGLLDWPIVVSNESMYD